MDTTTTIINALTIALPVSLIATPALALSLIGQSRWARGVASRNAEQAAIIAGLQRRLDDVSALRQLPPPHLAVVLDAAKRFREYEAHHRAEASKAMEEAEAIGDDQPNASSLRMRVRFEAVERERKAERNRHMAERLEAVLIQTDGGTVGVDDGSGRPVRTRPSTMTAHGVWKARDVCAIKVGGPGFYCSRTKGHAGPCEPTPDETRAAYERECG